MLGMTPAGMGMSALASRNPAQARAVHDDELYGQVAIELGFATPAMIESAMRLQSRGRGDTPPPSGKAPSGESPIGDPAGEH